MSYYHKPRPNPLDHRLLHDFVDVHAEADPDKEFMVFFDENKERSCLTFKQLQEQTMALATSLLNHGLERGDRCVVCAPNCFEYVVSWLALSRVGACAVLTCPGDLNDKRETVLQQLKCSWIICGLNVCQKEKDRTFAVISNLVGMRNADSKTYVKAVVIIGEDDEEKHFITDSKVLQYRNLLEQGKQTNKSSLLKAQSKVLFEDLVFALLSTGTTGPPKAVAYSHHAIVNAVNLAVPGGYESDSKTFSGWPMAWGCEAPAIAVAIIIGFTFVTVPFPKITPDDSYNYMLEIIQNEECDDCCIPQQDIAKMIAENFQNKYDFSNVEGFGFGGQIVPRKTISSLLDVFPSKYAVLVYASVEVFTVGLQPLSKENINPGDYGKMFILPDIEVQVVDEEGLVVPLGFKGEICVRGTKVFTEYLENPEATSRAKTSTGWVHTQDYGVMFEEGKIKVLGRASDAINRGSQKIFPVEIEDTLMEHPAISVAVIVGVPDKVIHEKLCACVIEVPGSNLESRVSELDEWCCRKFPSAECSSLKPNYFVFLGSFPIVEGSKIDRRGIARLAKEKLGL